MRAKKKKDDAEKLEKDNAAIFRNDEKTDAGIFLQVLVRDMEMVKVYKSVVISHTIT